MAQFPPCQSHRYALDFVTSGSDCRRLGVSVVPIHPPIYIPTSDAAHLRSMLPAVDLMSRADCVMAGFRYACCDQLTCMMMMMMLPGQVSGVA